MGVYINGMEMPTSCDKCPMHFYEGQGICSCRVLGAIEDGEVLKPWKNKRKDCPLVPVPKHGDLIDRNKLYEKAAEWEAQALHMVEVTMNDENTTEWKRWSTVLTERSAFKFDVADAPTIIPADPAEEGK